MPPFLSSMQYCHPLLLKRTLRFLIHTVSDCSHENNHILYFSRFPGVRRLLSEKWERRLLHMDVLYKSSVPVNTSCFKLIIFCHAVCLCSLRSTLLNIVHSLNRILIPFVCIHKILKRHIFRNLLNTIIDSVNDQMLNCFLISTSHAISINFIFQVIRSFQCLYNLCNRDFFRISLKKISSWEPFMLLRYDPCEGLKIHVQGTERKCHFSVRYFLMKPALSVNSPPINKSTQSISAFL